MSSILNRIEQLEKLERRESLDALGSKLESEKMTSDEYQRFMSHLIQRVLRGDITPHESRRLAKADERGTYGK
jgi:hypothetical protein